MPKSSELENPNSEAEQKREQKANEHNAFLNQLGVLMEVLDHDSHSCKDPLEKRIVDGVKDLKEKWLTVQEERDVLKNNNQELEQKFGELFAGKLEFICFGKHCPMN